MERNPSGEGEKIPTKSESLKEKKTVDFICGHSKDHGWETAIRGAVSGDTHISLILCDSQDICRNTFIYF